MPRRVQNVAIIYVLYSLVSCLQLITCHLPKVNYFLWTSLTVSVASIMLCLKFQRSLFFFFFCSVSVSGNSSKVVCYGEWFWSSKVNTWIIWFSFVSFLEALFYRLFFSTSVYFSHFNFLLFLFIYFYLHFRCLMFVTLKCTWYPGGIPLHEGFDENKFY